MKLKDWAYIAEIIGGIAIIASLIFVGVQIQDNSREMRSATYQAITDSDLYILMEFAKQPAMLVNQQKFLADPGSLEFEQLQQVNFMLTATLRGFENTYMQYKAGVLEESRWRSIEEILKFNFGTKGYVCYFAKAPNARIFSVGEFREDVLDEFLANAAYQDYVDECPAMTLINNSPG